MLTLMYAMKLARDFLQDQRIVFRSNSAICKRYGWILFIDGPTRGAVVVAHNGKVTPLGSAAPSVELRAYERAIGYTR